MPKAHILVVDDEADVREPIVSFLSKRILCEISQAVDGAGALEKLRKDKFDLVLLDIKMPGLSGIDVMQEAVKFSPQTQFLAISAYDSHDIANQALKAGAVDFILKPLSLQTIELKVKDILTKAGKYQPQEQKTSSK